MTSPIRIGVLGSTRGSGLHAFVQGLRDRSYPAEVVVVLSNKPDAGIVQRAHDLAVPAMVIPAQSDRRLHEMQLSEQLVMHDVNVVLLLGYMRILSPYFIEKWNDRIVNVHPSLLPDFSGLMDVMVHQAVIDAKKTETGCTVHLVNEVVDGGRILVQKRCAVMPNDTSETLKARVQQLEIPALLDAMQFFFEQKPLKSIDYL